MKHLTFIMAAMLALVLGSCSSNKNEEPALPDQELKVGNTFNISLDGTDWQSDNDKIASVKGKVVTANKVGEVKIRSGKQFFRVNVTPRYTYITDPYLIWGSSKATVKKSVKTPFVSETDTEIKFGPLGKETHTTYYFGAQGLARLVIGISPSKVSEADVLKFLNERYTQIGKANSNGTGEQFLIFLAPAGHTDVQFIKYTSPNPLAGTFAIGYIKF